MSERTEEVTEDEGYEDPEARAAMEEAQSVIDRVESAGPSDSTDPSGAGSDAGSGGAAAETRESAEGSGSGGGLLGAIPSPSLPSLSMPSPSMPETGDLFSGRTFAVALLAVLAAYFGGVVLLPFSLGPVAGGVGVVAVTFLFGLLSPRRPYLETSLACTLLGGVVGVLTDLSLAAATDRGVPVFAVTAAIGLLVALIGVYLGRDLRTGLTESLA